jgi:hypothetical protein
MQRTSVKAMLAVLGMLAAWWRRRQKTCLRGLSALSL